MPARDLGLNLADMDNSKYINLAFLLRTGFLGLALAVNPAHAVTIISTTGAAQNYAVGALRPTLVESQGFSITATYTNVAISVDLAAFDSDDTPSFQAYLTNQIGLGTTVANEIQSASFQPLVGGIPPPYTTGFTTVQLFSGLSLSPGTYWITLYASAGTTNTTIMVTAYGEPVVADIGATPAGPLYSVASIDPYPAATDGMISLSFVDGFGNFRFHVTGDAASAEAVPEPATIAMLGLGFSGLAILRRRSLNASVSRA